ncbi:hypothetical protein D3C86_2144540 [compost metagenome]
MNNADTQFLFIKLIQRAALLDGLEAKIRVPDFEIHQFFGCGAGRRALRLILSTRIFLLGAAGEHGYR